ncbi:unnamed protein product [Closterium sp. NIES-65]|nr:unnamed protein product [Closterium sp. NIES-65]
MPPDPGIESAALGASESILPGTASAQALHTFTLDSGASRCFFRDSTTVTPLPAPVPVSLADPSRGPMLARSTSVLPFPAVSSGELSGLHLPSFSTNLQSNAVLEDHWIDTFTPGGQRVASARALGLAATWPRSHVATQCECCRLTRQTLLWHHRLGHPSLPHLRSMHSRYLVSGLPRSLPSLPPSPAPPCIPCVEGRQCTAPHSSSFPPIEAPLQTLHMDVWGPARVRGQGHEQYFLLVVNNYTRYTTVFPLQRKGDVYAVLIPWIRVVRLQLRERFESDIPVLPLHSDRGSEFTSDLLRAYCEKHGIRQTFTLLASPQQNGIAERRIGLVMEVARTSMIHAAAPHFVWPFAVWYVAHQLNLWPRLSIPETSSTLRWTGEVGDASRFRVRGARAFVRDTTADKLSPRAIPYVFLGFVPDAPGWQFNDPASRRVFASQDVTFDESVPFYRLFPYRTAPLPPPAALSHSRSSPGTPPPPSKSCFFSLRVRSLEGLSVGVRGPGVLSLGVLRLGVLRRGAQRRLVSSLLGVAVSVVAPLVPRRSTLVGVSLSPHSSCVSGTLVVRVALVELDAMLREALAFGALVTLLLEVFLLEFLDPLVPEVLVLEVLELLGLELLLDLDVVLSTLRCRFLGCCY